MARLQVVNSVPPVLLGVEGMPSSKCMVRRAHPNLTHSSTLQQKGSGTRCFVLELIVKMYFSMYLMDLLPLCKSVVRLLRFVFGSWWTFQKILEINSSCACSASDYTTVHVHVLFDVCETHLFYPSLSYVHRTGVGFWGVTGN